MNVRASNTYMLWWSAYRLASRQRQSFHWHINTHTQIHTHNDMISECGKAQTHDYYSRIQAAHKEPEHPSETVPYENKRQT